VAIAICQSNAAAPGAAAVSPSGSPASPIDGLQSGTVIAARVLARLADGQVQLAIGNALIAATTLAQLEPGTTVQLALHSTVDGTTLQLIGALPSENTGAVVPAQVFAPGEGGAPIAATVATVGGVTAAAADGIALAATPKLSAAEALRLAPAPDGVTMAALTAAVRNTAATQNGLAPLFAEIAAVANLRALPEPVQSEAMRLLVMRPRLDGNIAAEDVKQAFANSGLFLEALLAERGQQSANHSAGAGMSPAPNAGPNAGAPISEAVANALPSGDLKAALIVFRQVLATALVEGEAAATTLSTPSAAAPLSAPPVPSAAQAAAALAPAARAASASSPPPPFRGGPTSAQPPAAATIDAAMPPQEAARILMAATDAALSRQTLLQAASLPVQPQGAVGAHLDGGGPRWNFEVPFATPQGTQVVTNVAQFEISRDGRADGGADGLKPVWRARFSIDLDPIGPVHAQISLRGTRTAVTLWAESAEGSARLRAGAASLADALRAAELDAADLVVRDGAPKMPGTQGAPGASPIGAGHFVDRAL
jgi:flagellar hook-length control protein FliK